MIIININRRNRSGGVHNIGTVRMDNDISVVPRKGDLIEAPNVGFDQYVLYVRWSFTTDDKNLVVTVVTRDAKTTDYA